VSARPFGKRPKRQLEPWEMGEGTPPIGVTILAWTMGALIVIVLIAGIWLAVGAPRP